VTRRPCAGSETDIAARCTSYSTKAVGRVMLLIVRAERTLTTLVEDSDRSSSLCIRKFIHTLGGVLLDHWEACDILLLPLDSLRRECDLSNHLCISPTIKALEVKPGLNSFHDRAAAVA
jgi:hypothetical protein